ncbi:CRISPR-associated RAMP protein, Cmr6 family [Candidatus Vecturithrix granuli]|uniref:CRISPR-associated RAMP protein, Cmr6 family n=1 Tax=Vecturithrix granuli TaxID=1499967 RepID=A0A081CAL2_VECG1|nr:CRISPR-associated RAMP protein, Cmr6 family [Candidatus Vecturithrix granuli]
MSNGFKELKKMLKMEEESPPPSSRQIGKIKKVLTGFGFIEIEGGGNDLFFHFSSFVTLVKAGQIKEGMRVSFDVGQGKGGKPAAINIEILDMPQTPPSQKRQSSQRTSLPRGEHYYLPKDTRQTVATPLMHQNRGKPEQQIDNFSLLLNKCAYYIDDPKGEGKFVLYRKDEYELQPAFPRQIMQAAAERHRAAIMELGLKMADIQPLQVDWRLIVGLGNESVYETSMTLHHIYGIPYIPGQAVKGVFRSWCLLEYFDAEEEKGLRQNWFCDIFGCPKPKQPNEMNAYKEARQGKVIFFDAFPIDLKPEHIQPDIMNPHYSKYYSDGKPPADWQDPVPVNFLTVQGATFEFFVGTSSENNQEITDSTSPFYKKTLLGVVQEQLPLAFSLHGIGAKTAVGYGYFSGTEVM